jgi:hypothetical protein
MKKFKSKLEFKKLLFPILGNLKLKVVIFQMDVVVSLVDLYG